jgi:hypothetical protein
MLGFQKSSERFKSSARALQTAFETFHKISIRFHEAILINRLRASEGENSWSLLSRPAQFLGRRPVEKQETTDWADWQENVDSQKPAWRGQI